MTAPLTYLPDFIDYVTQANVADQLWNELDWSGVAGNRREYYVNSLGPDKVYKYGSGKGERSYWPQPSHPLIDNLKWLVEVTLDVKFHACVLNGYADEKQALGWHSDDSPEVDPNSPIAVVSLGFKRDILFRPRPELEPGVKSTSLALEPGSLLIMGAGMQRTHQHRIPKLGAIQSFPRVSLTFRAWRDPVT